jgi:phosphoribosylaminoimidazolecarboxamide formyltransferase/IMP cyclohydrolase
VEDLTSYPSILDGRVKTLHPKIFGGILARREADHQAQLGEYDIPEIDLVIVDLYPFEDTVKSTDDEKAIIEKIDIGGIALIRAAAKNYQDVVIVSSKNEYSYLEDLLKNNGASSLAERKYLATKAFATSSHYDTAIYSYFNRDLTDRSFKRSYPQSIALRYGENPHQSAHFHGELTDMFDKLSGKDLSFNNLVDVDAAVSLMAEFKDDRPTFAILKHTNACGIASRNTISEAWDAALAGDPVSAFGGILISNSEIDLATAEKINEIFYEVVIAPSFSAEAKELLTKKKKRVLLKIKHFGVQKKSYKSLLNGVITQDYDQAQETVESFESKTEKSPSESQLKDLVFANKCVKHLKSNTIVLVKDDQLLGMGCGQTSRVDACKQAILKAKHFGFELEGSVMASDAFFPFPDCVEIAHKEGIKAVVQPGGSIKDQLSIDYCNSNEVAMVFTGTRHFKH